MCDLPDSWQRGAKTGSVRKRRTQAMVHSMVGKAGASFGYLAITGRRLSMEGGEEFHQSILGMLSCRRPPLCNLCGLPTITYRRGTAAIYMKATANVSRVNNMRDLDDRGTPPGVFRSADCQLTRR